MRFILWCMLFVLLVSSGLFAQILDTDPGPSWLFDSKQVSMHHAASFSYGTYAHSSQIMYQNSISYALSPKLILFGNLGYCQYGSAYRDYRSMLHGFGVRYQPVGNLQIQISYQGISPISGYSSPLKLNYLGGK
jgi:hypothetical protein